MGGGKKRPINAQIDEACDKAGGFGKFIWFCSLSIIFGQLSGGFLIHGLAYMELAPTYKCKSYTSNYSEWYSCKPDSFCDSPDIIWEIDYSNPTSINNWYTSYDLKCKGKMATALIGVVGFFGVALGCLFLPRMGDLYGRKPIFCVCLTLQAPLYFLVTYTTNVKIAYIIMFVTGPMVIGRMACGFLLIMELVHSRNAPRVGAALMVAEGGALVVWTIYFKWVSQNALGFLVGCSILNLIMAICCWFIPESPRWYFGME